MSNLGHRRKRRKLKAEINVVPYIDVMLVLLIIFMVTAPLMNLGVDIQLPQTSARSLQTDKEPAIVSVDQDGKLFLTMGADKREPIDEKTLLTKISAFVRENPQVPVLVAGDERLDYGKVMQTLVLLQGAGVPKVGLMSKPLQATGAR